MAYSMMMTWILVAAGLFALSLVAYLATWNRSGHSGVDGAISTIRSLDIEAFRNLVDPAEDEFLRSHLSAKQFREIKRARAWAALAYVRSAGKAAVLFAQAGQAAQRSPDPEIAESGMLIAHSAIRLRLYTIQAGLRLFTEVVLPTASSKSRPPLIDQYEQTANTLLKLGRLQRERA